MEEEEEREEEKYEGRRELEERMEDGKRHERTLCPLHVHSSQSSQVPTNSHTTLCSNKCSRTPLAQGPSSEPWEQLG